MSADEGGGSAEVLVVATAIGESVGRERATGSGIVALLAHAAGRRIPTRQTVILNVKLAGTTIPYEVGGG